MSNFITGQLLAAGGENEPMPSVLAVPIDELVVGLLAFFIVFGVLAKVALPKIKETLAARSEAIEGGLRKAEEAQVEAQRALEEYRAALASAREEAASIRSFMNGAFHHVHRTVLTEKAAHKFIVVSRDVDEPSAFPRLSEKLLDDIVVGLRPVDPSAQLPDINQVPHHV